MSLCSCCCSLMQWESDMFPFCWCRASRVVKVLWVQRAIWWASVTLSVVGFCHLDFFCPYCFCLVFFSWFYWTVHSFCSFLLPFLFVLSAFRVFTWLFVPPVVLVSLLSSFRVHSHLPFLFLSCLPFDIFTWSFVFFPFLSHPICHGKWSGWLPWWNRQFITGALPDPTASPAGPPGIVCSFCGSFCPVVLLCF